MGLIGFCTYGSLLRRLSHGARGVSHIVWDEVHESSKDIDIVLLLVREILPQNRNPRLVVMSATLRESALCQYFDVDPQEVLRLPGQPFVVVANSLEDLPAEVRHELQRLH